MDLSDVIKNLKSVVDTKNIPDFEFGGVSIDSRKCEKGSVFFALKGERADGNDYALSAIENGCGAAVVDRKDVFEKCTERCVFSKNSFETLKETGAFMLSLFRGTKYGITGSVGKSSTKEICSLVLLESFKTYSSYGNFNNDLGVPICASNIDLSSDKAVFEFGTNSPGEIASLSGYIMPDIAVVTSVGHSHIGRFGGKEELAKEKFSITEPMKKGTVWTDISLKGYAEKYVPDSVEIKYFGSTDECSVQLLSITRGEGYITFDVKTDCGIKMFRINHFYKHFCFNALIAIGIGVDAGMTLDEIEAGLLKFSPLKGRGRIETVKGLSIVDDAYNAGFESVMSAIENFSESGYKSPLAVIGEMGEIEGFEQELYTKIYERALNIENVKFYFVGEGYKTFPETEKIKIFENKMSVSDALKDIKDDAVLFKASRGRAFETLIEFVKENR